MKKLLNKNYWAMKGLALLVMVMMGGGVRGQTTLAAGDVAIISLNTSTNDRFSVVLLKDIAINTVINFTDCGFATTTTGRTGEGFLIYTAPSAQTAGTILTWNNGMTITGTGWNSAAPTSFALAAGGDQLFAFQGSTANWATQTSITLLYGINCGNSGFISSGSATSNNSYQPSGLTLGTNLTSIAAENGYFANGNSSQTTVSVSANQASLLNLISSSGNWYTNAAATTFPSYTIGLITGNPSPTLTAAISATVDADFDVTYVDDASWRNAGGTIVTIGGTTLTAGYSISSGKITFSPSASIPIGLLQTAGVNKAIVISKTGYNNATVLQTIGVGAANKLAMKTQPNAPATNGDVLATQPAIYIQDQYGNNTTSTLSVTASVGSGSWTIGGTSSVAAVAGTTTFSGLTATSSSSVTGATISFSCGALTGVTSSTFNIPAPGAAIMVGSITAFSDQTVTTESSEKSYTVSGSNLGANNITITPPVGFQISLTSGTGFVSNPNTIILTPSSGTVNSTTIYVKFIPSLVQSYSANITHAATGAITQNVAVSGTSIALSVPTANEESNALSDGFTANWTAVTGASSYRLDVATNINFSTTTNKLSENFSGCSAGSNATPDAADISLLFDTYLQTTGWAGIKCYQAGGELKLGSTTAQGYLITKTIDLSGNNGNATLSLDLQKYGSDATVIQVFHAIDGINYVQIGSDITAPASKTNQIINITGGTINSKIKIAAKNATANRFYLDNISIDQNVYYFVSGYQDLTVNTNSQLVTGLAGSTNYYYRVRAYNSAGVTSNSSTITATTTLNTWTGANSNWNNTANWSDGIVPNITANIRITSGNPTLDVDHTIASTGSLIISGTGTLTINPTRTLTIAGTADFGGKLVTLKSDATGSAAIGQITGTLSNASNLTVERFIPANRKYRFLAAPVVGATAVQWRDNGGTTPGIGTHITGNINGGINFDASTSNAPSAFWYNEVNAGNLTDVGSGATSDPGWTAFTNGNTQDLINGKGFRIFVRGDRTISLTGSIPAANNTTLSVTGTYPANSVSIATTKTNSNTNSGFNLVGNPYPATIDWNTITKGANISATYATFNPTSNSYVEWNGTTGDATRYIASGQAFFVYQESGTTSSITIAEANKVSNAAGNFFRNKLSDHLKVSMKYDSANYDAAFIHFREDALNEFDNYDGLKFQNAGVNIASVGANSKRYNINSLASLTETTEIPLSVLGSALTNFELKFEDVESFKNHELYLIDHYLNKMLLLSNGFTYPIELSSDSASIKDGRFKIVFVQKATGIHNNNKNTHAFILYPNPAANTIHLLLDAKNTNNENVSFEIFNQLGARLQQGNLDFTTAKDQTIAIDQLAQGSYFIKLQSNSKQQTINFIK